MINNKRTVAIIFARLGSSRLPEKVLLPLFGGKTVIEWITDRVRLSHYVDQVVVAIPGNWENRKLDLILDIKQIDHHSWFGNEEDVMSRALSAADASSADIIVDITADCPMVDHRHINNLCHIKRITRADYVSNCVTRTWPDGLDIQVYDTAALKKVKTMFDPIYHVGWNIAQHPEIFTIVNQSAPEEFHWPELGLTLDTEDDYTLLTHLFKIFGKDTDFKAESVINYLRDNPTLVDINKEIRRKTPDEG
jgi:spore coat polysaccharide biosynthesis protein SpsF